jgi:hypothetical protein
MLLLIPLTAKALLWIAAATTTAAATAAVTVKVVNKCADKVDK